MGRLGTVAIIGVGLIGGSIGLAIRSRKMAERVVGVGRDPSRLCEAVRLGAIDLATDDLASVAASAEIAVFCLPVTEIATAIHKLGAVGSQDLFITDAGSTKQRIVESIESDARVRHCYVGAHPLAGSERQGVAHARADLFQGRTCVLTPTQHTPAKCLQTAYLFWESLGCRCIEMSPAEHDQALAYTSHLPHTIAAALAASVPPDLLHVAAGAYRDGTRVAASDPFLWAGILRHNREPLLAAIDTFQRHLNTVKQALMAGDDASILAFWSAAGKHRRLFDRDDSPHASAPSQATTSPDRLPT